MWDVILTGKAGELIEAVRVPAPIETIRDWCRRALETRPDAVEARLRSPDGLFEYVYPEAPAD